MRRVTRCDIETTGQLIILNVEANAFLQHMVRNFAGVLLDIGRGRHPPKWAHELLLARNRAVGGMTAPPDGLYLTAVRYADRFALPAPTWARPALPCYNGPAFD